MSKETLVRKVLRSLPKRFEMNGLTVMEAQDVSTMRLDEMIGSLQTHEMEMNEGEQHMEARSVGLKSELTSVQGNGEKLSEQQYAMFTKNFGKFMRRTYNKGSDPGQSSSSRFQKDDKFQKGNKSGDFIHGSKGKGIQCRECEGYGHIQAECVNTQKKNNAYAVNWSDTESDQEGESNNFVALASCVNPEGERSKGVESKSSSEDYTQYSSCSDDEEITEEEIANNYKELFQQSLNEVERNKKLHYNLVDLKVETEKLWEEVAVLVAKKVEHQHIITDLKAQMKEVNDERYELVAQKAELVAVVSSLKIQIETSQGEHP
ncbi:unnamed protein product [Rhodiola kirilowii]